MFELRPVYRLFTYLPPLPTSYASRNILFLFVVQVLNFDVWKRGLRAEIIFYEILILWSFDETCWSWVRKMYSLLNFQQNFQLIEFEKGGRGLKLALVSDFGSVSAHKKLLNSWIKACISFRSQTVSKYMWKITPPPHTHRKAYCTCFVNCSMFWNSSWATCNISKSR